MGINVNVNYPLIAQWIIVCYMSVLNQRKGELLVISMLQGILDLRLARINLVTVCRESL